MHKDQSGIVTVELNSRSYWEVLFKPNSILTLDVIVSVYQTINSRALTNPVLMDWNMIQGIEFEALEYISGAQSDEHPIVIVSEPGSIGEKYAHLIDQLCERNCSCLIFGSLSEARNWLAQYTQKEA